MKNQKGITLVSLVVYVIVMIIVLGVLSAIINQFYKNNDSMEADTEEILKFNKFNTYFLKEAKLKDNKVDNVSDNYILFSSGNSFSLSGDAIYYNNIQICKGVKEFVVQQGKDGNGENENIVYIQLSFDNFTKSINYKIEEIY